MTNQSDHTLSEKSYPRAVWRLVMTPPWEGAMNMAIDEAILHAVADGDSRPTLRFYQWNPACLSLGYNQHWTEVNPAACERLGYTWTRRPTGGKAILHTDEVTYSLIVPQADPRIREGIVASYRVFSAGLVRGLQKLGVEAKQATKEESKAHLQAGGGGPVCFDTPSRYEITWDGRKLIGNAQLRRRKTILQHGSLPLQGDLNRILAVLAFSEKEYNQQAQLLPKRATTLQQATGKIFSNGEVETKLSEGLAEALNLSFEPGALTASELTRADELYVTQYGNYDWNRRV